MPEYIAIIICILILAATGGLKGPCEAAGIKQFGVCYTLLCALALSVFQLRIGVEVSINLGAAALVFLPGALMKKDGGSCAGIGAVMLISAVIALLKLSGGLYGADNGLLCGLMAGASTMILWKTPASAACAAGGIPVITAVMDCMFGILFTGYARVEIGHDTIAAQLIGMCICIGIIWIQSLASQRASAE